MGYVDSAAGGGPRSKEDQYQSSMHRQTSAKLSSTATKAAFASSLLLPVLDGVVGGEAVRCVQPANRCAGGIDASSSSESAEIVASSDCASRRSSSSVVVGLVRVVVGSEDAAPVLLVPGGDRCGRASISSVVAAEGGSGNATSSVTSVDPGCDATIPDGATVVVDDEADDDGREVDSSTG